jgi:hypothetical protein
MQHQVISLRVSNIGILSSADQVDNLDYIAMVNNGGVVQGSPDELAVDLNHQVRKGKVLEQHDLPDCQGFTWYLFGCVIKDDIHTNQLVL